MNKEILRFGECEIEFPAAIEMSNTTYKGLLKSIYKWEGVVASNGTVSGYGFQGCGLCEAFLLEEDDCERCPVAILADHGCHGTPYIAYETACRHQNNTSKQEAAEQELAFLKEIRRRSVIEQQ